MKKYYCYLARCKDGTLYTGYCRDLQAREERHNQGKGSRYTRMRLPIRIVYFETYDTRVEAMRREAQIKRWTRSRKEILIKT